MRDWSYAISWERESSPLARGLHLRQGQGHRRRRIIPARAGFTPPVRVSSRPRTDHPRTRGVYVTMTWPTPRLRGSSPHTRGLLQQPEDRRRERRIIPAHAGFTPRPAAAGRRTTDHPRTRGVYIPRWVRGSARVGSSPHTRGLRDLDVADLCGARIIPAHAGFTSRPRSCPWPARDHPRTRGVYVVTSSSTVFAKGSSPHTRGLPVDQGLDGGSPGIIPAHAGFTMHAPERMYPRPDHPRTRGVYRRCRRRTAARAGSSPHTRGLLGVQGTVVDDARIIPAHAGFTRRRHRDQHRSEDHPRTRGVYATRASPHPPLPGSSPHTRGLHGRPPPRRAGQRIIPAHAGFTEEATAADGKRHGSSPRVRGLRR